MSAPAIPMPMMLVNGDGSAPGSQSARIVSGATTNATLVKAGACTVPGLELFNLAAYLVFFKFYDLARLPVVGTDIPIWTIPIPAGGGYSLPRAQGFLLGAAYAITKLVADSDTTVIASLDVTGIIYWY